MIKEDKSFIFLVLGMTCIHLLTLWLPSVNLEFAFADAALYFSTGNVELLDQYFKYQANTIVVPYIGHLLATALQIDSLQSIRLLSTAGMFLVVYSLRSIARFIKLELTLGLYLLLLLNPLLWTFSGRATADVLPVGVAMFAMALLFDTNFKLIMILISGFVFGLACILKYHSILLVPLLFFMLFLKFNAVRSILIIIQFLLFPVIILLTFLGFNHVNYDFYLTPVPYQNIHGLNFQNFLGNVVGYVGFALMIIAPMLLINIILLSKFGAFITQFLNTSRISIIDERKLDDSRFFMSPVLFFLLLMVFFLLGFYFIKNNGELNFGPLNMLMSPRFSSGLLTMVAFGGVVLLLHHVNSGCNIKGKKLVAIGVGVFIMALSMTRPAQRYLIYILPFAMLILNPVVFRKNYVVWFFAFLYSLINIFIAYSQWATGTSAIDMVRYIESNNLIDSTDPGDIESHSGNFFRNRGAGEFRYEVVWGKHDNAIFISKSSSSLWEKNYSLIAVK